MTTRTIPEGATDGFRADIEHQDDQAQKAGWLLRHAADTVEAARPDETREERAQRMRGAAVLAQSAALELAVTCGWNEAAEVAARHELLDEENDHG